MKSLKSRKPMSLKLVRWAPFIAGGIALQVNLSGCDTEVRDTVLTGIQTSLVGLVTSMLDAFFLTIQNIGGTDATQTTKAIIHTASSWLA